MNEGVDYRRACGRCDWRAAADSRADVEDAAAQHAADTGHPRCILCPRGLTLTEQQTCADCTARVRETLAEVVELCELLPAELGHLASPRLDGMRASSSDAKIDAALVMLSPGGVGSIDARWDHARNDLAPSSSNGLNLESDPESVANTLGQWEDDWRSTRHEPAAKSRPTVRAAARYLSHRLTWAADYHPAFDEFATDVRRLRSALLAVTALGERPDRGEVACFDCGEKRLERGFTDPQPCPHQPPPLDPDATPPTLAQRIEQRRAWREQHRCDQGGRVDTWRCRSCGREYSDAEYLLALRARLEERTSG